MEHASRGCLTIVRLDHGEDVLESLSSVIGGEPSTMMIAAGLGMISEFELGYFDHGVYVKKYFEEAHELLSMQGSVASEGEPRIHMHVTVADKSHAAFGGHLLRGKVWMSNEIALIRADGLHSSRRVDPEKKVGILHLSRAD